MVLGMDTPNLEILESERLARMGMSSAFKRVWSGGARDPRGLARTVLVGKWAKEWAEL